VENGINGIEHITSLGTTLTPARTAEAYKQRIFHDNDARRAGRYEMWQAIGPESEPATRLGQFLAEQHIFLCPTLGAFEYRASPESVDTVRLEGFQNMMAYTKKLYDLGVPIVLGSHSWVRYAEKGWAYHHEMELLEQLGMPPLEIIRSATLRNAEFFRIADKTGTIEKGKQADLILVEGDPLSNIKVMRQLRAVMLAGRWIEGPGL
jgi:hypothetical protein